ncbi:hypothetical protein [Roseibium aggregatum]|uniref:hypothetical protein n=1 Tax=Roseibium aggregatum TaxID=187304 RepID=UPI00094ADCC9|nr:hypothetical protein [Roseibium aggregatum]UFI05868.1 hypothetical protein ST40_012300 [Roseibium aggregatum]
MMSVLTTIDIEGTFKEVDSFEALAAFLRQSAARVNFDGTLRLTVEDEDGREYRELICDENDYMEVVKSSFESKDVSGIYAEIQIDGEGHYFLFLLPSAGVFSIGVEGGRKTVGESCTDFSWYLQKIGLPIKKMLPGVYALKCQDLY